MRRTCVYWLAASALLVVPAGCRHGGHRTEDDDPSTIGRDWSLYPRGTVIPPAGIGVDLVRRKGAKVDPAASPASAAD